MDLNLLRDEIDKIDSQLVELFVKRMNLIEKVASYKIENALSVFDPEREKAVIARAKGRAGEKMMGYTEEFFDATMTISRHMQEDLIAQKK